MCLGLFASFLDKVVRCNLGLRTLEKLEKLRARLPAQQRIGVSLQGLKLLPTQLLRKQNTTCNGLASENLLLQV